MAAVTLETLRARARSRADMPVAGFIADDANGIDAWINEGHQKLHELLIKAYGEEYLEKSAAFNTVAGQSDVDLPADFMTLYGVDLTIGGIVMTLSPYNRAERNIHRNAVVVPYLGKPRYKLSGMQTSGKLRLLPAPEGAYAGTFWYAPVATLLVNTTDAVNYPNGWERYIVCYTAIQMKKKQEDDTRALEGELDKMEGELVEIAQRRNADQPHQITDIDSVDAESPLLYP